MHDVHDIHDVITRKKCMGCNADDETDKSGATCSLKATSSLLMGL